MPPKKFTRPRAADAADPSVEPKLRKPRVAKKKPADMSKAEWDRYCHRRRAETQGRKDRLAKLKLKQAQAQAEADEEAAIVPMGAAMVAMDRNVAISRAQIGLPPMHAGQYPPSWSMGSPSSFAPSSPGMFQESYGHSTPCSRFSPSPDQEGYAAHGGFDPNLVFPHCPLPRGPPVAGSYDSNNASSSLRRGPLPFGSSMGAKGGDAATVFGGMLGDSVMHDTIASGSTVAGGSAGYFTQEEACTNAEAGLYSQPLGAAAEADVTPDPVAAPKPKANAKRKGKAPVSSTAAAKKRNTDLAFLMEANPEAMDDKVKAWYTAQRDIILNQLAEDEPAPASPASMPTSSTTTNASTPSSQPTPSPPEEPVIVIAEEEHVVVVVPEEEHVVIPAGPPFDFPRL